MINVFQPRSDNLPAAIGGVAEQWFESLETMKTAFSTAEATHARADIENLPRSPGTSPDWLTSTSSSSRQVDAELRADMPIEHLTKETSCLTIC